MQNERQEFFETFKQNLAFVQLAGMHPEMLVQIDNAWGEHLVSVGWTREDYTRRVTELVTEFRERLEAEEAPVFPQRDPDPV